ncbi:MAG: hypothetical protein Q7T37_02035 [bacterium]|nr:hypothetical protein [bacterium]MDO8742383.1 hypothetical protein [bacterium]
MTRTALVLFKSELPKRSPAWWSQFDTLIAPIALESEAKKRRLAFESLESLVDAGSIQEAAAFLSELAQISYPNGVRVSESVTYQGYELWWLQYDELYYRQCLPYTKYRRLMTHLLAFSHVTLCTPPSSPLFHAFLGSRGANYKIEGGARSFPSLGIWLQVFISLVSWPLLVIKRPSVLLYTGDLFDPPRDHSFRMRFIYEELYRRKISFVEFIRSMEPAKTMISHALVRRRPVLYSYAIKVVISWLAGGRSDDTKSVMGSADTDHAFKLALASTYVRNVRGVRWSIRVMNFLIRSIGIRAALIPAASSRTGHEVLGCKIAGIPTIGVLHGAASRYYNVYDFMPEFRGEKRISLDLYGMWSKWWRDYYVASGKAYGPEQLVVSGPMRPMRAGSVVRPSRSGGSVKVLFVSEQLAEPSEVLPYLSALLDDSRVEVYLTFRSYRDGFEDWLKVYHPEILKKVNEKNIIRTGIQDAIGRADVVVGSHSTAVLEALFQMRPIVFFNTRKWGDYFGLESLNERYGIFANDPKQLVKFAIESEQAPQSTLEELTEMFFGDPHKNGSAWVVDEIEKRIRVKV